jgi:hypothetical protein
MELVPRLDEAQSLGGSLLGLGSVWWGFAVGVLTTVEGWCTVSLVMVIPLGVAGEHRIRLGHRVVWLTSSASRVRGLVEGPGRNG